MSDKRESIKRAKKEMLLIEEDLKKAEQYFNEENYRDCINKLFLMYENCANSAKDMKNHRPVSEHWRVTNILNTYFELGILKKDYSKTHKRLDALRKQASFGIYSAIKTKEADQKEVEDMLKESMKLVNEINEMIKTEENKLKS